ncbi:MCE family protein [Sphaerisporangium fuscum]|uniref:MCE family protein n=1 Tax=Sphaerisporangium fuscum TaxID=2835868 RepID=UPI001BDC55F4|nr:MCE family protein [Sphaerisporangium fuscum]
MGRGGTLAKFALFFAVTAGLIVVIALQIARVGTGGGHRLVARFDDVSGLREGDEVKIAGAPVGRVDGIRVVDGRAEVEMSVRDDVRIPADSQAAVRWRDALGRRVVYLLPGTSGDVLGDGARIARTTSVTDLGELVADLGPLTRSLDPDDINRLLTAAGRALDGNEKGIPRLAGDLDALTTTIARRRSAVEGMVKDYATVTGVIARRDKQIARLIDDLVTLGDAFDGNRRLVDDALVELSATVRTSDAILGSNAEELGTVVDRLSLVTSGVRHHIGEIGSVLDGVRPLLARAFSATARGHFVTTAVPCLAAGPPPCPYPMTTPPPSRAATAEGLRHLLVGGR